MGLNLLTALILQKNEVRCLAIGPFSNGKYGSSVHLIKNDQLLDPIISIEIGIYDTCKEAIDKLRTLKGDPKKKLIAGGLIVAVVIGIFLWWNR